MGYYTSYGLDIMPDKEYDADVEKFEKALVDAFDNDFEVKELVEFGGVYGKCYDLESNIDELAPKFPHLLIILSGTGEDGEDWEARWKGNDKEVQNSIIPPFNNKNLWTDYEKKNNNQ